MRTLTRLFILISIIIISNTVKSQCNTNTTICSVGTAGPFSFIPASSNPSFCLDFYNGVNSSNYAYIILYITQSGNLNLLINGNSNSGYIDVSLFDITGQTNPCTSLNSVTEIGCNYADESGGCNEFGFNFSCDSQVSPPYVNAGDVIMILVEDWSNNHTSFTLQLSNAPGSAQTGPADATITPAGPFLDSDSPFTMQAVDGGGTWSASCGSCIDPATGVFDPAIAGPGTHQICYDIGQAPCDNSDCTTIIVNPSCTVPVLNPITDVDACDSYTFPPIQGSNLTGNAAYYTGPGGTGTQYNPGDVYTVSGTQTIYVYDFNQTSYSFCADEISFVITIDTDNPIITCPSDATVSCISEATLYTTLTSFETDGGAVSDATSGINSSSFAMLSQSTDGNSCPEVLTRTYQIEDNCGHTSTCIQTITIHDVQPPTATPPASLTVECTSEVPQPNINIITGISDNCSSSPTVTFVSETSDGNVCNGELLTRTYNVTDGCGNSVDLIHTITIDSYTPTFTVTGTDPTMCDGSDGIITISGLAPSTDYTLNYNNGSDENITSDVNGQYMITGLPSGSYTDFTVADANCPSCSTTENITIILSNNNIPTVNAGQDQSICEGETITLTADNPDGATITWDNGVVDGESFEPPTGTTVFTATATTNNGCSSTSQVVITVHENPTPLFEVNEPLGCSPHDVKFTSNTSSTDSCFWDFGDGTTSTECGTVAHTYTQSGEFTVNLVVTDVNGCEGQSTMTDYIQTIPPPNASFVASPATTYLPYTEVEFINESTNSSGYLWDFGDGSAYQTYENINHTFPNNSPGIYEVILYADNNVCTDSTSMIITIKHPLISYEIPNVFTPNGDGSNDFFKIINPLGIKTFSVTILNRWGNVVYESNDIEFLWNGTIHNNGTSCNDGVYFYKMHFTDYSDEEYNEHGYVHLSR